MKQETRDSHELISALADGELRGRDFARAMALIDASAEARAFWHASHLAGDVLRARELASAAAGDADFAARLRQRLQAEPTAGHHRHAPPPGAPGKRQRPAANEAGMRWKLVAGFASFALLTGVAWHLVSDGGAGGAGPQLALRTAPAENLQQAPAMIRDPRLDQLLAAHQQLGGATALQKPAGFLRSATYERPAR